jgi:hypothetical protein
MMEDRRERTTPSYERHFNQHFDGNVLHEQHLQPHHQQYNQHFHPYYQQQQQHHNHQNKSNRLLLLYYKSEKAKLERASLSLEQKREYYTNGMKKTKQDIQQKSEMILSLEEQISQQQERHQQDSKNIHLHRKWDLEIHVQQITQHYDSFHDYIHYDLPEEEGRIQVEMNRVTQEIQRLKEEKKYRHHHHHRRHPRQHQHQQQQGSDHNSWRRSITTDHHMIHTTASADAAAAAATAATNRNYTAAVRYATALSAAPTPHIRQHCNRYNRQQEPDAAAASPSSRHHLNHDEYHQEPATRTSRSTNTLTMLPSSLLTFPDNITMRASSTYVMARNSNKKVSNNNIQTGGSNPSPHDNAAAKSTAKAASMIIATKRTASTTPHVSEYILCLEK